MTDAEKIERAITAIRQAETIDLSRPPAPHEFQPRPTYYRVQLEKEGRSEWSGGSWGGRSR